MHIVACIKQVLDQETPARAFRVNREALRVETEGLPFVLSIFDANAIEMALQLREAAGPPAEVTALTLGDAPAVEVLRKALAVTVNHAALVSDPGFEDVGAEAKALILAAAVRKMDPPVDLVLCGRQAGDWENGQVGPMLAEALGWPLLPLAFRAEAVAGGLRFHCQVDNAREVYACDPPLVCTVTNQPTNVLRMAKVRDVMLARRSPIATWTAADLGVDPSSLPRRSQVRDLYVETRNVNCEMVEGPTPEAQASNLVKRLRQLGHV